MKYFIIFVVFLLGCSDEHETLKKICNPFRMTISDAIPVQFWVNGVETFNQKEVCGINSVCFCQQFNCDDEIRIQFQETTGLRFELVIVDSGSIEIDRLAFSEVSSGVYEISFVPSEIDVCDENVRFIIEQDVLSILTSADDSDYLQTVTSDTDWTTSTDPSSVGFSVPPNQSSTSEYLYKAISPFIAGETINLHSIIGYSFTPGAGGQTVTISASVAFLNNALDLISGENILIVPASGSPGSGTQDETNSLLIPTNATYLAITATVVAAGGISNASASVNIQTWEVDYYQSATSDCIDVKQSHDCTTLIRYDNAKDFAGIEYTDFSPTAEFYLRIPAIFFHETNTEEEESFEESTENIVRLRNEIKVKRLLDIGFMPHYMHRKLNLILAHDTIEIDGENWIKRDPYEKDPGNKRYPLKKASVLLTQKDYIKRNIL